MVSTWKLIPKLSQTYKNYLLSQYRWIFLCREWLVVINMCSFTTIVESSIVVVAFHSEGPGSVAGNFRWRRSRVKFWGTDWTPSHSSKSPLKTLSCRLWPHLVSVKSTNYLCIFFQLTSRITWISVVWITFIEWPLEIEKNSSLSPFSTSCMVFYKHHIYHHIYHIYKHHKHHIYMQKLAHPMHI